MRLKFLTFAVLCVALLLAACGPADTETVVLNIGWTGEPDSLNPGLGEFTESYVIYDLVYSALYAYKTDGTFALDLAESAVPSADELTWTFKLRPNLRFSDGQPLTAADVVFSFRFYASYPEDFPFLPGYTTALADVVATAPDEVVITLKEAIPNLESQLFTLYILPKHIWATVPDPVNFENLAMIGSGPFKLVEFQKGQFLRLAANDSYYGGRPTVDEVVFKTYANSTLLTQALLTGEVDVLTAVPIEMLDTLKSAAAVQVVSGPPQAAEVNDIILNQIAEDDCPLLESVCSGHPALRDRIVRQALSMSTNKQELIDNVMLGLADPGLTLIPTALGSFYNNALADYPFDLNEANHLLEEAGYLDTDDDGVREQPDGGRPLIFRLQWEDNMALNEQVAVLLQAWWRQIGIEVQLEALDSDALASNASAYDFDILIWAWSSDPDPSFLLSVPVSSGIASGFNETGYNNPTYDQLFEQQAAELNPIQRQALVWEMQKILLADAVYIIPYYPQAVQAYRTDKFTGWDINSATLSLNDPAAILKLQPLNK